MINENIQYSTLNKKPWKYGYILLVFLFIYSLNAQVPGYLGKRFTIQYNAALGSRIFINTLLIQDFNKKHADSRYNSLKYKNNLWFDVRHDLEIGYVFKKSKTLDLRYSFFKTGMAFPSNREETNNLFNINTHKLLNQNITGHHITLGFKGYFNGIAPIGIYLGIFTGVTIQNYKYTDIKDFLYKEENKKFFLLGIQFGKRYLFDKGFFLDIGTTMMWTNHATEFDYTRYGNRSFLFNFLRVHGGVGYIF